MQLKFRMASARNGAIFQATHDGCTYTWDQRQDGPPDLEKFETVFVTGAQRRSDKNGAFDYTLDPFRFLVQRSTPEFTLIQHRGFWLDPTRPKDQRAAYAVYEHEGKDCTVRTGPLADELFITNPEWSQPGLPCPVFEGLVYIRTQDVGRHLVDARGVPSLAELMYMRQFKHATAMARWMAAASKKQQGRKA